MAKKKKERPEGSGNNKGIGILLGIMIVITWLSVMCLLIKCDVGGFGSKVLRPVLKDIPVINKILPDASDEETAIESDYPYDNLQEALNHIAEQDAAIGSKDAEISELNDKVTELQAEVDRLSTIAKDQSDFEDDILSSERSRIVFRHSESDIELFTGLVRDTLIFETRDESSASEFEIEAFSVSAFKRFAIHITDKVDIAGIA